MPSASKATAGSAALVFSSFPLHPEWPGTATCFHVSPPSFETLTMVPRKRPSVHEATMLRGFLMALTATRVSVSNVAEAAKGLPQGRRALPTDSA
jgi:hypothetical protein